MGRLLHSVTYSPVDKTEKPVVMSDDAHSRLVLKYGENFMVMDDGGCVLAKNVSGCGFYRGDTRFLSQWEWTVNGERPVAVRSSLKQGYSGSFVFADVEPEVQLRRDL